MRYRANFRAIRKARDDQRIKQSVFAEQCELTLRTIQNIESERVFKGKKRFDYQTLKRVELELQMPSGSAFHELAPPTNVPWVAWQESNLEDVREIGTRMGEHLRQAGQLLSWANFLPCSLETPEFTERHHESIFGARYQYPDQWKPIVEGYNLLGSKRREALLSAGSDRKWNFTHMMFFTDLARIADLRSDEYSVCSASCRRECLLGLIDLLTKRPDWRVRLALVTKEDEVILRSRVPWNQRHFDSLVMPMDGDGKPLFAFWRDDFGKMTSTDSPVALQEPLRWLTEFRNLARIRDVADVVSVLRSLHDKIAEGDI